MKGKIVLITGGSDGIGKATAKGLAKKGATVVIVGRNETKTRKVCDEINAAVKPGSCDYLICEFSSQQELRKLAATFSSKFPRLDVLINNAGMVMNDYQLSVDGVEIQFAVNHLAPFLLTHLLLDSLKNSSSARIVNVSSEAHYQGKLDFEDLYMKKNYSTTRMYAQTKLCNVLFTNELARRLSGSGITVNALHPGMVKTDIGNKSKGWIDKLVWTMLKPIMVNIERGAETSIFLALAPEVAGKTGMYFDKCKTKRSKTITYNETVAGKLWEVSENLCGLMGS